MRIKTTPLPWSFLLLMIMCCSVPEKQTSRTLYQDVSTLPFIEGKSQYLESPFLTAGDRVYMVGHQDGSFPDMGWHIDGEMGGIWNHPIKLMDGFTVGLSVPNGTESYCLDKAEKFINYPMANSHHFIWKDQNIRIDRFQFVPDAIEGAIVEFRITNTGSQDKEITFSFTGMTDLRPTWLGERTNMIDAEDELSYDEKLSAVKAKDKNNPWFVLFGSTLTPAAFTEEKSICHTNRKGLGKDATLSYSLSLKANIEKTIPFFIAGSAQSESDLRATYALLKNKGKEMFAQKIARYKEINNRSHLTIPDKNIEQMYEWLKYNTDWLVRNVPEHGVGLSAGIPDYPWWFGTDATYALQGVLAAGDHELAKNTILLLHNISKATNTNGRIVHEVSTNGSVYNPGNVNETAQFITLVNTYYAWTGDKNLISTVYPEIKKGINWLMKEMDPDGNGYPNGSGMMEIPGLESELEMIDVAVYTQQALASAAELARALDDKKFADAYQRLASELKVRINREWWQPTENSFGDFRGTVKEAEPILAAALIRSDTLGKSWAVTELNETRKRMKKYPSDKHIPHVIYHNWVVNTPLETGIADYEKGQAALKKSKLYENPFGVYVTGIDRTDEPDSIVLKSRKKTFSYIGAVMTLPTGVQAVAAARYGTPQDALEYITKLHRSFSYALPGSMYEVSPDFGMITQAWNNYGVNVPIIQYFFGIKPRAPEKVVMISPRMPSAWEEASLENVRIGSNTISVSVRQKEGGAEYRIQQTISDWTILFDVTHAAKIRVNNREVDPKDIQNGMLRLNGNEVLVHLD